MVLPKPFSIRRKGSPIRRKGDLWPSGDDAMNTPNINGGINLLLPILGSYGTNRYTHIAFLTDIKFPRNINDSRNQQIVLLLPLANPNSFTMRILLLCLFASNLFAQQIPVWRMMPPAENEFCHIDPQGKTVLPNGRYITPPRQADICSTTLRIKKKVEKD
jgi:hypothetical protein